jgi:hypothetical protein
VEEESEAAKASAPKTKSTPRNGRGSSEAALEEEEEAEAEEEAGMGAENQVRMRECRERDGCGMDAGVRVTPGRLLRLRPNQANSNPSRRRGWRPKRQRKGRRRRGRTEVAWRRWKRMPFRCVSCVSLPRRESCESDE